MDYTAYGNFILSIREPFYNTQSDFLVRLVVDIINDLQQENIVNKQNFIAKIVKHAIIHTIKEGNYKPIKSIYSLAKETDVTEIIDKDLSFAIGYIEDNTMSYSKTLKAIVENMEMLEHNDKKYKIGVINKNK